MDRQTLRQRLELAAELVSEGGGMSVRELWFASEGEDRLVVCGNTRHLNLQGLTKAIALKELQRVKDFFDDVLDICPDFIERCQKSKVVFALADNYRVGGVGICDEAGGEITWLLDLEE